MSRHAVLQCKAIQRVSTVTPASGEAAVHAAPAPERGRSFADLERSARVGHRFVDIPTHAPPHPATVVQRKTAFGMPAARPPHPVAVARASSGAGAPIQRLKMDDFKDLATWGLNVGTWAAFDHALALLAFESDHKAVQVMLEQMPKTDDVKTALTKVESSLDNLRRGFSTEYVMGGGGFALVEKDGSEVRISSGAVPADGHGLRRFLAKLTFQQVKVTQDAVQNGGNRATRLDALDIETLGTTWADNAETRGTKAGSILLYELALLAESKNIGYIVAGNVTGARDAFYYAHGFGDYKNAMSFNEAKRRKEEAQNAIRTSAAPPKGESKTGSKTGSTTDLERLLGDIERYADIMANNRIFISTALLKTSARTGFQAKWQRRG